MYCLVMLNIESFKTSVQVFSTTYSSVLNTRNSLTSVDPIKSLWADKMIELLKIDLKIIGSISEIKPLLLIGNHISYLDIALLVKSNPDFSFVAKKEIGFWPVFGKAAKAADTIFVKRENGSSRASARKSIQEAFLNNKRVVIFPSGTTTLSEHKPWKKGAFEIAQENNVLIQPFRITYSPLRAAAYIENDFFPFHLYQLARLPRIKAQIEFHQPVPVVDALADTAFWSHWAKQASTLEKSHEPEN